VFGYGNPNQGWLGFRGRVVPNLIEVHTMKWLLIIPTMFVLVWSGEVEAKTTFYECRGTTYKLDEPFFGKDKFYVVRDGKLKLLPSVITDDFIRYWLDDKQKAEHKEPPYYINRYTGKETYGRFPCKVSDKLL
jgi:hypothetical protein